MTQILMPKATAVWLIENTALSFEQIGAFTNLHPLEVQGIADGEVAVGIVGQDPIGNGQLTAEEIKRCEEDPSANLKMAKSDIPQPLTRTKGPRYTPVSKRQDKPDAVAWLIRHHPELSDAQVSRLIGTTKQTIAAIRDRSHWNAANLRPRDPVLLGLCTQTDLNASILKARKAAGKPATLDPLPGHEVHEEHTEHHGDEGSQSRWGDLSALFPTKG
ncbi:DUF1013 domain-containing protein [Dongia mobilis]|jgi:hypothetical protein|uniref:DUF1013 domain-containing protein n=1 Tax=Dongia sp. TaxID=1977262 RepID=UPI0026EEF641